MTSTPSWQNYEQSYIDNNLKEFASDDYFLQYLPKAYRTKAPKGERIIFLFEKGVYKHVLVHPLEIFELNSVEAFRDYIREILEAEEYFNNKDTNTATTVHCFEEIDRLGVCSLSEQDLKEVVQIENADYKDFNDFVEGTKEFLTREEIGTCLLFDILDLIPEQHIRDYLPTVLILLRLTKYDAGLSRTGLNTKPLIKEKSLTYSFLLDEFYLQNFYCLTSKKRLRTPGLFSSKTKYDQFVDKNTPDKFHRNLLEAKTHHEVLNLILEFVLDSIKINESLEPCENGYIPKLLNKLKGFILEHFDSWARDGLFAYNYSEEKFEYINADEIFKNISSSDIALPKSHLQLHYPAIYSYIKKLLQEFQYLNRHIIK